MFTAVALSALALSTAAGFCTLEKTNAEGAPNKAVSLLDKLLLPDSYEEYLALTEPLSVSATDDYTAIADGNVIHVYDRTDGVYRSYTHGEKVSKLQFDRFDNLYFSDTSAKLYLLTPNAFKNGERAMATGVTCSTFLIVEDALYYTISTEQLTNVFSVPLASPASGEQKLVEVQSETPLAFFGGELYYLDGPKHLYKLRPQTPENRVFIAAFPHNLTSLTVAENVFACTTDNSEFFTFGLNELAEAKDATRITPLHKTNGGYSALTAHGGYIYTAEKTQKAIRQYALDTHDFTEYEICADSPSAHRLSGATDVCLAGDKLLISDVGNARISVYDTDSQTFAKPLTTSLAPQSLASDGETLLAVNATHAALYSLDENNYGETLYSFSSFEGNVIGAANVYGTYYLATSTNYCYALTEDLGTGVWTLSQTLKNSTHYPDLLTADVYGTLYIASGNDVYAFSEAEFTDHAAQGEKLPVTLPAYTQKIAVDYRQNVYALADNVVYKVDETADVRTDFSTPLVYKTHTQATSFTFGVEENEAYVLFDGNHLAISPRLALPTVKTIPVNGADEEIFSTKSAEIAVVQTDENALMIEIDVAKLNGAEHFPYLTYKRERAQKTALKLGETADYAILAVFDERKNDYDVCLTPSALCTPLPQLEYQTEYAEKKTGYLTNAVYLYKFPYLTDLLTAHAQPLPRGGQVELLGEVTKLDHDYYHVAYLADGQSETITGYIPKTYVTPFSGMPPTSETVSYGKTESDRDSVWRLVYIALGFAAVCILTDYLLLRKKKDD